MATEPADTIVSLLLCVCLQLLHPPHHLELRLKRPSRTSLVGQPALIPHNMQ
jgi:hypothetical protein